MIRYLLLAFSMFAATVSATSISRAQGDRGFSEEFRGQSLPPAFRVANPDKNRFALVENEYFMILTHDEFKNVLTYKDPLPSDYIVTVRVEEPMLHNNQIVRIRIGTADNNIRVGAYLSLQSSRDSGVPTLRLSPKTSSAAESVTLFANKTLEGEVSRPLETEADGLRGQPFLLRIAKTGVEYEMFFSQNDAHWVSLGKQVFLGNLSEIALEAFKLGDVPETGIKFDYFEIKDLSQE